MIIETDDILTVDDVMKELGLTNHNAVIRMVHAGKLRAMPRPRTAPAKAPFYFERHYIEAVALGVPTMSQMPDDLWKWFCQHGRYIMRSRGPDNCIRFEVGYTDLVGEHHHVKDALAISALKTARALSLRADTEVIDDEQ